MSIDWRFRQGNMGRHKHFADDIVDSGTGSAADLGDPSVTGITMQFRTFTVNYNDPGITDYTRILWTPAPGDIIFDLWAIPTIAFAGATTAKLYIGGDSFFDALLIRWGSLGAPDLMLLEPAGSDRDFGRAGDHEGNVVLDARSSHLGVQADSTITGRSVLGLPAVVGTNGTNVVAQIEVTGSAMSAGQLKVYAIIGTPT